MVAHPTVSGVEKVLIGRVLDQLDDIKLVIVGLKITLHKIAALIIASLICHNLIFLVSIHLAVCSWWISRALRGRFSCASRVSKGSF